MSMIWFRTYSHTNKIEAVVVEKCTATSVWVVDKYGGGWSKGNSGKVSRAARESDYMQYHESWDDAKAYLLKRAESRVVAARRALETANADFGNIKGMKPPKEEA